MSFMPQPAPLEPEPEFIEPPVIEEDVDEDE